MGDRALIIFAEVRKDGISVSPTAYLHWGGSRVPALLIEHKALMQGRFGDLEYAAARFIGIVHAHDATNNLSLGVWNTAEDIRAAAACVIGGPGEVPAAIAALEEHSHGDAGVVVVNVEDFTWKAFGGYLAEGEVAA